MENTKNGLMILLNLKPAYMPYYQGIPGNPMKKTLPVTLTYFVGPYATNYVQMFAAIIIAIAPTVVVYSLFSNQIVEGLTTGAVKG